MGAAERDRKLVADLATHRTRLGNAKVVGIGRGGTAQQARLHCHEPQVVFVTNAARLTEGEGALVDPGNGRKGGGHHTGVRRF